MAKDNKTQKVDVAQAFFDVPLPKLQPYMNTVLLAFVQGIPTECHQFCLSRKNPGKNPGSLSDPEQRLPFLRDFVDERLTWLAQHEYIGWVNGKEPFVGPRDLQLWRLRMFVQFVWFWNLPDDDVLALIFNLTVRRASGLAADFEAKFRKTVIYPVALRRLYYLIHNGKVLNPKPEKHPKSSVAVGDIFAIPSIRYVTTAKSLAEDIRNEMPHKRMADPFLWNREQLQMWLDREMLDVVKTDDAFRERLFDMYKPSE
jgi:hypothetical protein